MRFPDFILAGLSENIRRTVAEMRRAVMSREFFTDHDGYHDPFF